MTTSHLEQYKNIRKILAKYKYSKTVINVSQGSVAKRWKCDEISMNTLVAYF